MTTAQDPTRRLARKSEPGADRSARFPRFRVPELSDSFLRRIAPLALEIACVAVLVMLAVLGPITTLTLVVTLIAVVVLLTHPRWSIYLCVVFAFTAFPAALPTTYIVAGYTFYAFEPFLAIALVYTLVQYSAASWANLVTAVLLVVLIAWVLYGVVENHPIAKIIFDVRPMTHLIASVAIAARVGGTDLARRALKTLPYILWFSAAATVLASTTGLAISGSAEQATLYLDDASSAATRLRSPTTDLALVVLCVCICLFISRRVKGRALIVLAIPAFLIVFLAYSRYTVVGIAVALTLGVLAGRSFRTLATTAVLAASAVVLGIAIALAAPAIALLPGGSWVGTQVSGFEARVLGGLTTQVISEDGSAQFRLSQEDAYLNPAIAAQPVLGYGFGDAYKQPQPPLGSFYDRYAPYYAHNYYLWILLKTGIVGTTLFLSCFFVPVLLAVWRRRTESLALAVSVGVLMACSVVAPMPNGDLTATLLGASLGLLVTSMSPAPRRRRRGTAGQVVGTGTVRTVPTGMGTIATA